MKIPSTFLVQCSKLETIHFNKLKNSSISLFFFSFFSLPTVYYHEINQEVPSYAVPINNKYSEIREQTRMAQAARKFPNLFYIRSFSKNTCFLLSYVDIGNAEMTGVFNSLTGIPFPISSKSLISIGSNYFFSGTESSSHQRIEQLMDQPINQASFIIGVRLIPQNCLSAANCIDSAF
jgi:hypothetical protein